MPRRLALFVLALLAVLGTPRAARAAERELIVPFHEGGHLVLDQLSGMRLSTGTGLSYAGPVGFAFRTEKADAFAVGAPSSELKTTTFWLAPSADVFVLDHFSVGGLVEIAHTRGSGTSGEQSVDLPGQTSMTFVPRVGFYAAFSDRLGLWPRVGLGWTSRDTLRFSSNQGSTAPTTQTFRAMVLDLDVSLVYRFNETFFLRMGPQVGVTLGGRHTMESGGSGAGADGSVVQVGGLTQLGVNLEL